MNFNGNKAEGVKIAYIGGGSRGWAWTLMSDLAASERMSGEVTLYDIDYDAAYANVIIGNSGQSIAKIGCATTAIAMLESKRTNTTIYPHNMMKKLSYTSGGAVYWPSNYTQITSSSGYLTKIYNLLEQGKPVIVGAKNSNGGQHYVVVTGVKATNTLTTSSFYINDPGSNTRTTLNQFFSAYPYFYKMLHY